ncbi:MAG: 2'-deoxycytidine 5'-triphosphate deaminase [Pseudomonadota bacterium]
MNGVLTTRAMGALIEASAVRADAGVDAGQIQPSSLDLTLGPKATRLRASFLPGAGRTVEDRLSDGLALHEIDLAAGGVLERGCVYLVELRERLALPADVAGFANPKSSTGRIDVFVRLVTDGGVAFDDVSAGYSGPLYLEISPQTFSIVVREGSSLNQIRFRRGASRLSDEELTALAAAEPLTDGAADIAGGVAVGVDLKGAGAGSVIGYRAKRHSGLIDIDRIGALDPADYWEPVAAPASGGVILDPDEFYILASKEKLRIPPAYAAEMAPFDPLLGEFRAHYAGFFDPGFGCREAGARPSKAVLEVRSREAPFLLEHGQNIARLVFERLAEPPERLYGEAVRSNYQGQGLKLSKHFRV